MNLCKKDFLYRCISTWGDRSFRQSPRILWSHRKPLRRERKRPGNATQWDIKDLAPFYFVDEKKACMSIRGEKDKHS